jgi:hypothetical protein
MYGPRAFRVDDQSPFPDLHVNNQHYHYFHHSYSSNDTSHRPLQLLLPLLAAGILPERIHQMYVQDPVLNH